MTFWLFNIQVAAMENDPFTHDKPDVLVRSKNR
jgi:hypothetical protein